MNFNKNSHNFSVPDSTIFDAIRQGNSSVDQAVAYYQALDRFVNTNYASNPQWQIALDQFWEVERILKHNDALPDGNSLTNHPRDIEFDLEPQQPELPEATETNRSQLQRSFNRQKSIEQVAAEILAAATSKNPKLALTKVAAINNFSYDLVESMARSLIEEQGLDNQYDLQKSDYERCIGRIRDVELTEDPGLRDFKLHQLAREYRFRGMKDMMDVYYKSLLVQHLEDPVSLDEYRQKNPESVRWLMRGWIPEGSLILLHGHGGLGKTLFVHHLFKHLVKGIDWGEYKVETGRHGILYIQTDTPLAVANQAMHEAGLTEPGLPISIHGSWRVEFMSYLYNWIKKQRPALVVIDSLTSVNRANIISENTTEYARPVLQLKDMAVELNTSFFIIHHSNGAGEARGSRAIRNAVDAVWRLEAATKNESDLERVLVMEKFRGRACSRYRMKFDDENFDWDLLEPEEGQPEQNINARKAIVEHLNQHRGVRFCNEDLAEILGFSILTVRKETSALAREGAIDKQKNLEYNPRNGANRHFYLLS